MIFFIISLNEIKSIFNFFKIFLKNNSIFSQIYFSFLTFFTLFYVKLRKNVIFVN